MSDEPIFGVNPIARCSSRLVGSVSAYCGRPARWHRQVPGAIGPVALCDQHACPGDLPLDPAQPYRRIRIQFEVYYAGVSQDAARAEAEAVDRLRAALEVSGGIPSLVTVASQIGRPADSGRAGKVLGELGRG
ncbi:MAG: hypothetical protein ACRD1V_17900 [Vicinamibacterales bacterium]